MGWIVSIGEVKDGVEASDWREVALVVAGVHAGAGGDPFTAKRYGEIARLALREDEKNRRWDMNLPPLEHSQELLDGRTLWIRSTDPLEQCDGLDSNGDRCGKPLHHRGPC